jgi:glucan phosphoethanolaminetransferase (alkaline phosphatase superfamily)
MRSLLRPNNLFVLATYLALSLVPFIPLAFGKEVKYPAGIAGMEVVIWLVLWAVCKRPLWFHWILLPAFLALPVELYLRIYYGQGISPHHLGIIGETSPREAIEFLGSKIWLLVAAFAGGVAWFWLSWRAVRRTPDLTWSHPTRLMVLVLLTFGIATWIYGREVGIHPEPPKASASASHSASTPLASAGAGIVKVAHTKSASEEEEEEEAVVASEESGSASASASVPPKTATALDRLPKLPYWSRLPLGAEQFGATWPLGLAVHGYDFWKERSYLSDLSNKSKAFKFGATHRSPDLPQVVVMVIGESSRYDRWSINGYKRETNPLLKNETNLVSLTNVVTAVSATRLAVPVLVSRKPATQSLKAEFAEKSFLSAYKEAGFKTYWLSNQMAFGKFDTPVSVYADEADITQFLNVGGFTTDANYDEVLLAPLKKALADPAPKKLIVLHTLGNHWNYSHRHPKQFDKWQPSLFGVIGPAYTDIKMKQQLNNSYDNSILYTDWFLSQVIGNLKSPGQLTSLMYVSDHGQTLYDGSCDLAFHGHNTEYEFHVPAFVWYSDRYKATYPDKINQLIRHKRARLATENIFHSLLDMGDISYGSERLERSFLSKKLRPHIRYVDSYGWTDYDQSTFKGDCREVIAKGKPLDRGE